MSQQPAAAPAQPQEGDWPPGYVPGEGFVNPPQPQEGDWPPDYKPGQAPPPTNGAPLGEQPTNEPDASSQPAVQLNQLKHRQQWVDCPNCKIRAQTMVQGRSEGKRKFMNVFWWPLPNREHWWETTHWYCQNCKIELASQKNGKELQILVK